MAFDNTKDGITPATQSAEKSASRPARRSVLKLGERTVIRIGVPKAPLGDAFHWLMRASWPIFFMIFAAYYLVINAVFGLLYFIDLGGVENARPGSFGDAFMFSVQTIATIGYGHLLPRSWFVNGVVVFESMSSFLMLSLWTGLAFARFSRPTARVMFSKVAVVTTDNGVPTLMFRVANGRGNRIVDATVSVTLLKSEVNKEGTEWRRQIDLKLVRSRSAVFVLTWTVLHRIDETSPLRDLGDLDDTSETQPQLAVSVIGTDDTFGQPIHAMFYYNAGNILRGKRFVDIARVSEDGTPTLDFTRFDDVTDA